MRFGFILLTLLYASSGYATTVNKCVDANGRITFTQSACDGGVQAEPVKIMQSSSGFDGGGSVAPSRKIHFYDIDFSGDAKQRMRKASAVIQVVLMKARDCEFRLKVSEDTKDCSELLGYFLDGSVYNRSIEQVLAFSDDDLLAVKSDYSRFLRDVEKIVSVKDFVMAYTKSL